MQSRGRPRNEEETCVLSVRLPVVLRDQLDHHITQLEKQTGIKASRTDMIRHALRRFLEADQSPVIETPQEEPPQPTELKPQSEPITRRALILEYFAARPNTDLEQQAIASWARAEYPKRTGEEFRDPERQIRTLANSGAVTKVGAGFYRYEPPKN